MGYGFKEERFLYCNIVRLFGCVGGMRLKQRQLDSNCFINIANGAGRCGDKLAHGQHRCKFINIGW